MTAHDQITNIVRVFALSRSLTGKQVAFVDDVVTSCSTLAELAKVLKSGGAVVVDVWAYARMPV